MKALDGTAHRRIGWLRAVAARRGVAAEPRDPVLVVDDDAVCAEMMAMALERDGHRVEWTTDPVHALALVRARRWAAIVSDVNMPGMTGTALAAEAVRSRPGLRTLLVTAVTDPRIRAEAEASGSPILVKPVRIDTLVAAVRDLVRDAKETVR